MFVTNVNFGASPLDLVVCFLTILELPRGSANVRKDKDRYTSSRGGQHLPVAMIFSFFMKLCQPVALPGLASPLLSATLLFQIPDVCLETLFLMLLPFVHSHQRAIWSAPHRLFGGRFGLGLSYPNARPSIRIALLFALQDALVYFACVLELASVRDKRETTYLLFKPFLTRNQTLIWIHVVPDASILHLVLPLTDRSIPATFPHVRSSQIGQIL
jgi:hypothetical protein